MNFFSNKLSAVEGKLFENVKKNKTVFPEEIEQIESGLLLITKLTKITKEASKQYPDKPNYSANHELFARNRQLLFNAYISLLFSSYGTNFVILRSVLENNNLMRLFNKNSKYAFEWLSKQRQGLFTEKSRKKFGKTRKCERTYKPSFVRKKIFDTEEKLNVRRDIKKLYSQLCDYTHPNYSGWKELVVLHNEHEFIQNVPLFLLDQSESALGLYLFMLQLTLKAFVETFKEYLVEFNTELTTWQEISTKLLIRHQKS